ncbi:MAG: hypothetical protein HFI88_14640 [Lachnospiraceae bacterium]|nr:hypothetical protein [Lachnospiraceae bacterium]
MGRCAVKCIRVFLYQFERQAGSKKTVIAGIFLFLFLHRCLRPVAGFCLDAGRSVTPWVPPFLCSDYLCQIFFFAMGIFLLSAAADVGENQLYILHRAGPGPWEAGTLLYILFASFLFVLGIFALVFLNLVDVVSFDGSWGKIIGTLAQTDAAGAYAVPFSFPYTVLSYTPGQAMILTLVLETCGVAWFGFFIYTVNSLTRSRLGLAVSLLFLFLDVVIFNSFGREMYRFSPVSLCQPAYYNGDMAREGVTLPYTCGFFVVTILGMGLINIMLRSRKWKR